MQVLCGELISTIAETSLYVFDLSFLIAQRGQAGPRVSFVFVTKCEQPILLWTILHEYLGTPMAAIDVASYPLPDLGIRQSTN